MTTERIVIIGGPLTGKTTFAKALAAQHGSPMRSTDDLLGTSKDPNTWSYVSETVAREWFAQPGPWIVEGVAAVRALRKWLTLSLASEFKAAERESAARLRPCDVVYYLKEPHRAQSDGQGRMTKGIMTVWDQISVPLMKLGVEVRIVSSTTTLAMARETVPSAPPPGGWMEVEPRSVFIETMKGVTHPDRPGETFEVQVEGVKVTPPPRCTGEHHNTYTCFTCRERCCSRCDAFVVDPMVPHAPLVDDRKCYRCVAKRSAIVEMPPRHMMSRTRSSSLAERVGAPMVPRAPIGLIMDDPYDAKEAETPEQRKAIEELWRSTKWKDTLRAKTTGTCDGCRRYSSGLGLYGEALLCGGCAAGVKEHEPEKPPTINVDVTYTASGELINSLREGAEVPLAEMLWRMRSVHAFPEAFDVEIMKVATRILKERCNDELTKRGGSGPREGVAGWRCVCGHDNLYGPPKDGDECGGDGCDRKWGQPAVFQLLQREEVTRP